MAPSGAWVVETIFVARGGAIVLLLVITGEARVLFSIFEFLCDGQLVVASRRYTVIVTIVKLKLALNTN